jgi:hypothetical protein
MRIEILDEPQLEFGGARRHVDPRFGIAAYGPADLGLDSASARIRLGLGGPGDRSARCPRMPGVSRPVCVACSCGVRVTSG